MEPVVAEMIKRIEEKGGITFSEFMEIALYHPRYGYYTSHYEKVGKDGDFITSPEVHPFFGKALGVQILEMWEIMGKEGVTVVELGGGRGSLARQIVSFLKDRPEAYKAIDYKLIEKVPQSEGLEGVEWCRDLEGIDDGRPWIVISNEFFDALPFHRIRIVKGRPVEVYVGYKGSFYEFLGPLSNRRLLEVIEGFGLKLLEGMEIEVSLGAIEWMRKIGRSMGKGFVITIDYGFPAKELYSERHFSGTLLSYYRHRIEKDPYKRIGKQDITCHVNFTLLATEGRKEGLEVTGFTDQGSFLIGLGAIEELSSLGENEIEGRMALRSLFMPGFGDTFKVLIQHKGVEVGSLKGLIFRNRRDRLF